LAGNNDNSLGGYLQESLIDVSADPLRDSGANPTPTNLTMIYGYDPVGNVVATIDGRGIQHTFDVNPLNQVVHSTIASSTAGAYLTRDTVLEALSYQSHEIFDANDNVIETRVGNQGERDGTGASVAANPFWSTKRRFDILDDPITVIQEVAPIADDSSISESSPGVIVTRYAYDADQNLTFVTEGEGNVVSIVYDERSLRFSTTRGYGTAGASTTKRHYDLNGNPAFFVSATKKNPTKRPDFPEGDVFAMSYDGFDRMIQTVDGESNLKLQVWDPADHQVRHVLYGPAEEGNPRLAQSEYLYDELGRAFVARSNVFTYPSATTLAGVDLSIPTIASSAPGGETFATTLMEYDALSRGVRTLDPKLDESLADYDGAGRLIHSRGPFFSNRAAMASVANEAVYSYDGASNLIQSVATERSPTGVPDESFTTDLVYDAVGRVIRVSDPLNQTSRVFYDSRSNVIAATDAKSSATIADPLGLRAGPATINGHGNVSRMYYDGISRGVRSERLLKTGGVGDGNANLLAGTETNLDTTNPATRSGIVVTQADYDRNSRLTGRTDANGNRTANQYDALDRRTIQTSADGTFLVTAYDLDDDALQTTDANGTITQRAYDGLGRLLTANVTNRARNLANTGQNVLGTTLQALEYDGLSRVRSAIDDNGAASSSGVATDVGYDSLSRKLTERHRINASVTANAVFTTNGRVSVTATGSTIDKTVTSGFAPADSDAAFGRAAGDPARVFGARTSVTYSSGRKLTLGIDGLDRTQTITDSASPSTPIAGYEYVGGRVLVRAFNNGTQASFGYDGDRRLTGLTHQVGAGPAFVGFGYGYDGASNRTFEQALHKAGTPQDQYTYDSLYRVTGVAFGVGTNPVSAPTSNTTYQFDGVNNFVKRVENGVTTNYDTRANGAYNPDLVNRYTKIDTFSSLNVFLGETTPVHDAAGAQINQGGRKLYFDAFERLAQVDRSFDGGATFRTVGAYTYDAFGRRVTKNATVYDASGNFLRQDQIAFVNDGSREIEEVSLVSPSTVVADYVYGSATVDEPVQMRRGGGTYYYHQNSILSVAALTDAGGNVVERYEYPSIYGKTVYENSAGTVLTDSLGNPVQHSSVGNPFTFQGRRFDEESGLLFFRNRYLDPEQGRFVNRDPIGIWGDSRNLGNGYAFAAGNPVNRRDPFGLDAAGLALLKDMKTELGGMGLQTAWLDQLIKANDLKLKPAAIGSVPKYESYDILGCEDNLNIPSDILDAKNKLLPFKALVTTLEKAKDPTALKTAAHRYAVLVHELWHQWNHKFGKKQIIDICPIRKWDEVLAEVLTLALEEYINRSGLTEADQIARNAEFHKPLGKSPWSDPKNRPSSAKDAWKEFLEHTETETTWTEEGVGGPEGSSAIKDMPFIPTQKKPAEQVIELFGLDRTPDVKIDKPK
jgi:RHS repeat-associated protein